MGDRSRPYQPLILRLLHGINALLVIGAWVTGFLVYDSWDRRFGGLSLSQANRSLIDIHGTFGFFVFFVFIALAFYSLRFGRKRLIQSDSFQNLARVNRPIWWFSLHRIANTIILIAASLAVISGKFQSEQWLPEGEMNHTWYYVHLIAWVVMGGAIALHVLMSAKVGGVPLLQSMLDTNYRPEESPKLWYRNIRNWLRRPRF